ncbi:Type I Iterative PKS [Neofusicoccum ribis]|uniref:Type I Iterative PKS n=1 Tax=Neofusicoccum ribis TaxID=45134 RepID=A0ABR3SAX0_9PEZI
MAARIPISPNTDTVLLFGSQALSFDQQSFRRLSSSLLDSQTHAWALRTIEDLPEQWDIICAEFPKLQAAAGAKLLPQLGEWLETGTMGTDRLPNILLSPLVVIAQLTEYAAYVELRGADSEITLPPLETLGFCIGILSAMAVSCSTRKATFEKCAAAAVRLAMLIGAVVDAQDAEGEHGESATFTTVWKSRESGEEVARILERFPEAYVSVSYDENRASVTTSRKSAPDLEQAFQAAGITFVEIGLCGRFHSAKHSVDMERLLGFCDAHPEFALPDATALRIPARSNTGEGFITQGRLHHVALRTILLQRSEWYKTFAAVKEACLADKATRVLCFGPEKCIPPSLLRSIGSQVLYFEDLAPAPQSADAIAVVGMSINVAGANDVGEFWQLLAEGKSQHKPVPADRFGFDTVFRETDASRTWYGNFVDHHDTFDHKFFKKTPREAASMDPQQRLLVQAAYQAVEQSGYFQAPHCDKHIGCYVGLCGTDYDNNVACHPPNAFTATGNLRSFIAGKVSHYFGWTGPGLTVDTACSGSAVAVHQACRAILTGECTAALAGGTNIMTQPLLFQNLAGASFLSPTGQCKPFDALADGYCRGEAIAAVFLKKMSAAIADGDQILGSIASTAVYQNQNCTPIFVPNAPSLSDLFRTVLDKSGLDAQQVSVVEAHGTGTPVGDPAEYESIRRVFGGPRAKPLQLGSVKGLVGHTEGTSGAVSLVKVLLMLQEGSVPPQASFTRMNPAINATPAGNMQISTTLQPWDMDFRAALINNYGASGSNASMIVTQAPKLGRGVAGAAPAGIKYPFWLCGLDDRSIRAYATKLRCFLKTKTPSIANLSFNVARQSNRTLDRALIFHCRSVEELDQKLAAVESGAASAAPAVLPSARPVILCFGGQISTSVALDRQVYDNAAVLRKHLDRCDAVARTLGAGSIYPGVFQKEPVEDIVSLQTMLFAVQYGAAKSWIDCGVRPAAVVGHSFGELTAMCVSGVLDLKDAMKVIIGRAKIIRDGWGPEKGSMLAVEAGLEDVLKLLADSGTPATIACFNGPRSFTIAGSVSTIDAVVETMSSSYPAMRSKRLCVTNAFHSTLVEPLKADLNRIGEGLTFNKPAIPLERATEHASTNEFTTSFVAEHLRNPVYFNHAIQRLAKQHPSAIWLEAGSNATITSMAAKALGTPDAHHFQAVNISGTDNLQKLIDTTMNLWRAGLRVAYWAHSAVQTYEYSPLLLPPYQFDRQKHWLELKEPPKLAAALASHVQSQLGEELPTKLWTFAGYQDSQQKLARFRINTMIPAYEEIVAGHTIAGTAPICPATVQIDIAIEALRSLHPDLSAPSMLPTVRGVANTVPICVDPSRSVWLDVEALDAARRTWAWQMRSTGAAGAAATTHVSGEVAFRRGDDAQYALEFGRYERLVSHARCERVLQSRDRDVEAVQGRSIYRLFADVVGYGERYFGLQTLVGRGAESAGRVVRKHAGESWLDAFLADCFCQVAGIWVNCMTDRHPGDMYIANGIEQWVRSPRLGQPQAGEWNVFANHSRAADGSSFLSDIFVFDAETGALAEVILGINYAKVSRLSMSKLLSRLTAPGAGNPPALSGAAAPELPAGPLPTLSQPPKAAKSSAVDEIVKKLKLILADISGLEVDEIKDDVELGDIGVDSLMGMEMAKEIETAFKCALPQEDLMHVTDFPSLLKCLKSALDIPDDDASSESDSAEHSDDSGYGTPASADTEATTPLPTPPESSSKQIGGELELSQSVILEAFGESKLLTDKLIEEHNALGYLNTVVPKQDQLCVALTVEAFRELGCDLATATPGQKLERIPHVPEQGKLAEYLYTMLEETRIVDLDGAVVTRTVVSVPAKPSSVLLQQLVKNFPDHACSNELAYWTGSHLAGVLTGKEDGIKLIFGTEKGRELVSGVYGDFPLNKLYYKQMGDFLARLLAKVPHHPGQGPLRILEMGAGTGATTKNLVPLLASLGVPVEYTFTDLASSFVAAARKRFKQYPFVKFRVHDIEKPPADDLVGSQHIVIASNAVHATRSLAGSAENIRKMLRPDGLLMVLEMTMPLYWVDIIFGVFEGWWLFEDGRTHAIAPPSRWEQDLHRAGYGHVDWSDGHAAEVQAERVIIATASGQQLGRLPVTPAPPKASPALNHDARRAATDGYVREYTEGFSAPDRLETAESPAQVGVLITGATGSVGAHLAAHYASLPDVQSVVCLNRRSGNDPERRQREALESKGIVLDEQALSKLTVFEADTAKPWLGLSQQQYSGLLSHVTHIVHNAWPMNAKRPLKGFELQFQVMRNLLDLAAAISAHRPAHSRTTFQLISSIATVGHHPLHTGQPAVPETRMTIESVLPNGYGDAKHVCERMLDATLHTHPSRFRAMSVRLGQVAGSSVSGHWNSHEHLAFLLKSAQTLRALPALSGPLSWTPVDAVAGALADLALAATQPHPVYHVDNPVRQPWADVLPVLAEELGVPPDRVVPFAEWIARVRAFPGPVEWENPAAKLVDFLEEDFERMSCGGVLMGTERAREHSETMRGVGPVGEELVRKYVRRWKESGFLYQ